MNQIFKRVSRIINANKDSSEPSFADFYIKSEDDELKSIIDELSQKQNYNNKDHQKYSETAKFDSELSIEQAFLVLGISQNSNIDEIKSAYKTKVKEYHPDKVSGLGAELINLAQIKTQQINAAYNIIKNFKNFN